MKPRILRVWMSIRPDANSSYVGVQCKAQILTAKGVRSTLSSQGCWGVRSTLGQEMASVEKEECDQLKDALACLGFGHRAIEYAFKKITVEKKP